MPDLLLFLISGLNLGLSAFVTRRSLLPFDTACVALNYSESQFGSWFILLVWTGGAALALCERFLLIALNDLHEMLRVYV